MGNRKQYTGTVIADKMQKTVTVKVIRMYKHAKYNRIMKTHNKFKVHDEKNTAKVGDVVRIEETRPLSKDKHFMLVEIIKKSVGLKVELKDEVK